MGNTVEYSVEQTLTPMGNTNDDDATRLITMFVVVICIALVANVAKRTCGQGNVKSVSRHGFECYKSS